MTKVGKWMSREVITIEKDATVIEAIHCMKEKRIERLPVMDHGRIAGIVTEKMLAEFTPSRATSLDLWEIHYILSNTLVSEAMNPEPCKVSPDTDLSECAKVLHDRKLGGVLVVDENDNLIGIFTVTDALEALIRICRNPRLTQE
ncbi:MAG TPA: CBS domain-containing protein [Geobacteraceae bacterium]